VPGQLDFTQQARGVCEQLAAQLGETVNIAVRRSHFVVNIDQARGPSTVATHNWVGELTPLHATSSGKVLLAYMTPEERRNALVSSGLARLTPQTITSQRELEAHVEAAARDGYAFLVEELEQGLNARRRAGPRPHRRASDRGAVRIGSGPTDSPKSDARGDSDRSARRRGDQPPDGPPRLTRLARSFRQLCLQPVVEVADVMLAGHQHPAVAVGA
jgi:hypothetical protein